MKRVISLFLCVALCFSCLSVSSSAGAVSDVYRYSAVSFWNALSLAWDGLTNGFTWLGDLVSPSPSDLSTAYNSYVTGLDTALGTHVIGDNGFRIYVTPSLFSDNYRTPNNPLRFTYSVYATHFTLTGYFTYCWIYFNPLVAPVDGIYTRELSISRGVNRPSTEDLRYTVSYRDCAASTVLVDSDSYFYLEGSDKYYDLDFYLSYWVQPHNYNVNTFVSGGSASRAPSIITNIINSNPLSTVNNYYIGTKTGDTITNVYETNIFNEETKVLTIPGETPVEHTVTNWKYDYSTRTYNLTDGTNKYVVTYGDDYITITVPDGNGGTTSTNYYYVVQEPVPVGPGTDPDTGLPIPSTDNYEDDPNTTGGFFSTIWKAIKKGLADLIAGIIDGLFKGIKALINGVMDLFSGIIGNFFGAVGDFFDSFSDTGVFGFFHGDLVIRGPTYGFVA